MPSPTTRSRFCAALCLTMGLVGGFPAAKTVSAQTRPVTRPDSHLQDPSRQHADPGDYYPLTAGAIWKYRVTVGDRITPTVEESRCMGSIDVGDRTCQELLICSGRRRVFEYWTSQKDGVYLHDRRRLAILPGLLSRGQPRRLLAVPVGVTLAWRWTETNLSSGAGQDGDKRQKTEYRARVEDVQDKIQVPAGSFVAARVRIKQSGGDKSETVWWFARGVGPVKRVQVGHHGMPDRVHELIKHTPGVKVTGTPEAVARRFVTAFSLKTKLGEPSQFRMMKLVEAVEAGRTRAAMRRVLPHRYHSRFFVVRWKGRSEPLFIRVHWGRASEFDPADVRHWQLLVKDEWFPVASDGSGFGQFREAALQLAQALALFVGEMQGPDFEAKVRLGDFTTSMTGAGPARKTTINGLVRSGSDRLQEKPLRLRMEFNNKTVSAVESRSFSRTPRETRRTTTGKTARKGSMSAEAFCPLAPGTTWRYRVSDDQGGDAWEETRAVTGTVRLAESKAVSQILIAGGARPLFEYLSALPKGIYRHRNREFAEVPGLDMTPDAVRILAAPVGAERAWKVKGRLGAIVHGHLSTTDIVVSGEPMATAIATVTDFSEKVALPAGRYGAVHVRLITDDEVRGRIVEHSWFARGVGLIKRKRTAAGVTRTWELMSFKRGDPEPDPGQVVRRFLKADRTWAAKGRPTRIVQITPRVTQLLLRSTFLVIVHGDERTVLRIFSDRVVAFDPMDKRGYEELLGDEGLDRVNGLFVTPAIAVTLAGLAARLRAKVLAWTDVAEPRTMKVSSTNRKGLGGGWHSKVEVVVAGVDGHGRRREIRGQLALGPAKIESVHIR